MLPAPVADAASGRPAAGITVRTRSVDAVLGSRQLVVSLRVRGRAVVRVGANARLAGRPNSRSMVFVRKKRVAVRGGRIVRLRLRPDALAALRGCDGWRVKVTMRVLGRRAQARRLPTRILNLAPRRACTSAPAPTPAPAPAQQPAPSPQPEAGGRLSWAPPALVAPTTVEAAADADRALYLDAAKDYVVRLPPSPLTRRLVVDGGRNVVIVGGHISVADQGLLAKVEERRGLVLKNQTGTVHVEGLRIDGDIADGVILDQRRGAVVQLQNLRIGPVRARDERDFSDVHPDVLQSWAGPGELRIDGLSGITSYQGLFLAPTQEADAVPRAVTLRRIDIQGLSTARYLLWQDVPFPLRVSDTFVVPARGRTLSQSLWSAQAGAWAPVRAEAAGAPPYVPDGVAGTGYVSPGYAG